MLTKEELVSQDTKPLLKEVSLELYKEFCEDILFKKTIPLLLYRWNRFNCRM